MIAFYIRTAGQFKDRGIVPWQRDSSSELSPAEYHQNPPANGFWYKIIRFQWGFLRRTSLEPKLSLIFLTAGGAEKGLLIFQLSHRNRASHLASATKRTCTLLHLYRGNNLAKIVRFHSATQTWESLHLFRGSRWWQQIRSEIPQ